MKNQKIIWSVIGAVVVIIIIVLVARSGSGSTSPTASSGSGSQTGSGAAPSSAVTTPVGQVASVSATTKNYQNPELGFSVDYPSTWGLTDSDDGPTFTIPSGGSASVYTLQSQVYFVPGACAFPPVATSTIIGQSTLAADGHDFKMIKVATTAHSLSYLDEMYTLQLGTAKAPECYVFSFASTAAAPVSAANQSVITAATKAFTTMVESFGIVTGPAGQSETAHPNGQ